MPRILVVEDDPEMRALIKHMLTLNGYEAVLANDGLDALKVLEGNRDFNMILSDIRMSKMDGLQLLDALKVHYPEIPVVMLSAHVRGDWLREALQKGADGYMLKPFTLEQLLVKVEEYVP